MEMLFIGPLGTPELIVIVLVVLLLFGGKKIPELMRGIGKGVKSFKHGMQGIEDDINASLEEDAKANTPAPTALNADNENKEA